MEVPLTLLAEKVSVDDRGRLNLCGIMEEVIVGTFPVNWDRCASSSVFWGLPLIEEPLKLLSVR